MRKMEQTLAKFEDSAKRQWRIIAVCKTERGRAWTMITNILGKWWSSTQ